MSEKHNPALERLFAAADGELGDEDFVARVMARTSGLGARRLLVVLAACLVAIPATWLAAGPLDDALLVFTRVVARPLVNTGDGIASSFVLPMNSVGGALVLTLFALRALARRLLSAGS